MPGRGASPGAGDLKHLAHEVRNALNGISVNLEVARSRAARGSDVAQIAPFLETAAQQLDFAVKLHKRFADLAIQLASESITQAAAQPSTQSTQSTTQPAGGADNVSQR